MIFIKISQYKSIFQFTTLKDTLAIKLITPVYKSEHPVAIKDPNDTYGNNDQDERRDDVIKWLFFGTETCKGNDLLNVSDCSSA